MAGKDDIADAVLGGASDFMNDIFAQIVKWFVAKDDQKVFCVHQCPMLHVHCNVSQA